MNAKGCAHYLGCLAMAGDRLDCEGCPDRAKPGNQAPARRRYIGAPAYTLKAPGKTASGLTIDQALDMAMFCDGRAEIFDPEGLAHAQPCVTVEAAAEPRGE